jgi:hypothetical protein
MAAQAATQASWSKSDSYNPGNQLLQIAFQLRVQIFLRLDAWVAAVHAQHGSATTRP